MDSRPSVPQTARRLQHLTELRETIRFRRPKLNVVQQRLSAAVSIADLRRIGRRVTPRAVFNYVDGGADDEVTVWRNLAAFTEVTFHPEALRPVDHPQLSVNIDDRCWPLPLAFSPTGYTRMMHHHGEAAVARVAEHYGIPYTLSTVGTSSIEDIRQAAPNADLWFQFYATTEPDINERLLDRAAQAGYSTLVITSDVAVSGNRRRERRSGLSIPPTLRLSTVLDMVRHPYWWMNKLTTPQLTMRNLTALAERHPVRDVAGTIFDPALSLQTLKWARNRWSGRLLVKGVTETDSATQAIDHGADGVILSNHGGRQLDRTHSPLTILTEVRDRLGHQPLILIDSGIRGGQDIVTARALGADAAMVGRAYLYGLMAGGQDGVARAYEILAEEYQRTLQLLGVRRTVDLDRRHVSTTS